MDVGWGRERKTGVLLCQLSIVIVIPPPLPVPPRVHRKMQRQQLVLRVGQWDDSWKKTDKKEKMKYLDSIQEWEELTVYHVVNNFKTDGYVGLVLALVIPGTKIHFGLSVKSRRWRNMVIYTWCFNPFLLFTFDHSPDFFEGKLSRWLFKCIWLLVHLTMKVIGLDLC